MRPLIAISCQVRRRVAAENLKNKSHHKETNYWPWMHVPRAGMASQTRARWSPRWQLIVSILCCCRSQWQCVHAFFFHASHSPLLLSFNLQSDRKLCHTFGHTFEPEARGRWRNQTMSVKFISFSKLFFRNIIIISCPSVNNHRVFYAKANGMFTHFQSASESASCWLV